MVQLIIGESGKGKTKILLDKVNAAAAEATGNIVFIDKDNSHMYELKNTIRLVNTSEYYVSGADEFSGFVSGIISADHDLQELYIDRLLKVACIEEADVCPILRKIDKVTQDVKCTINISITEDKIEEDLKSKIIESL